ncbi:DNA repair protein complementing XP-C cells homolog [Macrobrachium nipponense]|uniref:DNA repair protein complementing XP-C cells homolog n=1 Tax=Macrobrachium nipponense TaxID=159736 RepID=UPI0030C87E86
MAADGIKRTSSRGIRSCSQSCKVPVQKGNIETGRKKMLKVDMATSKKGRKTESEVKVSDQLGKVNLSKCSDKAQKNISKVQGNATDVKPVKHTNSNKKEDSTKKLTKDKHEKETGKIKKERKGSRESSERRRSGDVSKAKFPTKTNDVENDFSKIESMIFEDHLAASEEKTSAPGKKRGRPKKGESPSGTSGSSTKKPKVMKQASDSGKRKTADRGKKPAPATLKAKKEKVDGSDSDASDWEEVDEEGDINELEALLNDSMDTKVSAKESVKIELDAPDLIWGMKKRKKRRTEAEMIEEYLRRHVNRSIRELYENMHKAHVLCLFAHGQFVNKTLNSEILLGSALSIITEKNAYPPKRLDMSYLEKFVSWFSRKITLPAEDLEEDYWNIPLEAILVKRFGSKTALTNRELVFMFIIIARALGMNVRLILSLQPMSWKPNADALIKRIKEEKKSTGISISDSSGSAHNFTEAVVKEEKPKVKNNRKMLSSDSDVNENPGKGQTSKKGSSGSSKTSKRPASSLDGSDSDFDPSSDKIKKGPKGSRGSKRKNSSDDSSDRSKKRKLSEKKEKNGNRKKTGPLVEWAEVYVEEEEKWMCIDVTKAKIHCILEIEARTPSTSGYITAYNADLTVKDVTRRYISTWLSNENKLRCDSKWWQKSIRGFMGKKTRLDREEDEEMDQILKQQPLPKSIGEYKNHPLYALQRHLLKFEAIYPPDETPVGYIKGEPVYPRSSIYTLHSRDIWMKEAKTVRVGEEPYKVVKARPKWDRETCQVIKDRPLEVFGEWQVEDYEPPVAVGGKVPRNEYGNVELFKPSMLPKGCVHIPIAGLNRIARKLNIDCASAITGFDFHSGWSHPVYEGFVVCEEYKDVLLDAWNEDQVEQAKRAEEKREKRIYNNWKKLINGMLVRERVREKYGTYEVPEDEAEDKSESETKAKVKKVRANEENKTKVTQADIDAARPPLVTHSVKNLQIDLTSNVVEMAQASRRSTMKTKNARRAKPVKEKAKSSQLPVAGEGCLGDSSDETDEEEKKEKIRAILQWGTKSANAASNLSDDSDCEEDAKPSCSKFESALNTFVNSSHFNAVKKLENRQKKRGRRASSDLDEESDSGRSSRSTTPEVDVKDMSDIAPRRVPRRSVTQKTVMYEESDEGDISLGESDLEDKTFDPVKVKSGGLNLSDSE